MNNRNSINFSVSIYHHPISKQSSLKYLGVILDDKQLETSNLNVGDTTPNHVEYCSN